MAKIVWSPRSLLDIDSIAEFIARDSSDRASLFALRIIEITNNLIEFPLSGRIIPEFRNPNRRELIYGAYRIMYQIDNDLIKITAVVHGSKNISQPN